MKEYVAIHKDENTISLSFYLEQDKIMAIGEKMNAIHDEAYMNGYNWEAFFNGYLSVYNPAILDGMESDPEAGMYAAYFEMTPKNENKANTLIEIIEDVIENTDKLFDFLKSHGDEIEWD